MSASLRVGIVGFGFMGRTHLRAYRAASAAGLANDVVAVADADPARRAGGAGPRGNLESALGAAPDLEGVRTLKSADALLTDPGVDLVSICTHTDTHVDLALRALAAGKHVLVEKPVALQDADVARLRAAAAQAPGLCMPAHCMRFWPAWRWLKERVDDGAYGGVRSATFQRLGAGPTWSRAFYADDTRSGGALVDLHLHDADAVRWLFGEPDGVHSTGTIHHVTTQYRFPRGPAHVVAEGGWDLASGFPFRMRFTVAFERATADFELGRSIGELLLARDGTAAPVALEPLTGYDGEIRHLLRVIASGGRALDVTLEDAERTAALLARERASLEAAARGDAAFT